MSEDDRENRARQHARRELVLVYALSVFLLLLSILHWHRTRTANRGIHVLRAAEQADFRIDLNAAGVDELRLLPNVGPATAERIVAWRRANGPFERPDDLAQVRGISTGMVESLRPYVRCGAMQDGTVEGEKGERAVQEGPGADRPETNAESGAQDARPARAPR